MAKQKSSSRPIISIEVLKNLVTLTVKLSLLIAAWTSVPSMKPYWTPSRMPRPTPSVVVTAPPTNGRHPTLGHTHLQQRWLRPHKLKPKSDSTTPMMLMMQKRGVAYILTYQKSPPTPLRPLFSYKKQTSSLVCGWPGELHRPTSWLHLPRLPPSAGPAVPTAA